MEQMKLTMKEYLLLRANTQSGPYSLRELAALPLRPHDLVWVNGESQRWEEVSERPELGALVVPEARRVPVTGRAAVAEEAPVLVAPEVAVRAAAPDPFRFHAATRKTGNGLWIVALFACLVGGAVVVQQIIDNGNALSRSAAITLATEPLPQRAEGTSAEAPAGFQYQNALKRETFEKAPESDLGLVSLRDLRKAVTLRTNTDKEGVFDGINDVQIRVHNESDQELDQVNIEVSFLHPDGTPWHKESCSVSGLKAHADKILVLAPPVKRGARVKYKLTGVSPKAPAQTPA